MQVRKNTAFIDALFYMIVCVCLLLASKRISPKKRSEREERENYAHSHKYDCAMCICSCCVCMWYDMNKKNLLALEIMRFIWNLNFMLKFILFCRPKRGCVICQLH